MEISYESIYFIYQKLKNETKEKKFGLITNLSVKYDILQIFQKFGLIILEDKNYLFLEIKDKGKDIDLFFLYRNYAKLGRIFDENDRVVYMINYVLFNIDTYLTPKKLINQIKKELTPEIFNLMKMKDENILFAHNFLIDTGFIKKLYCSENMYFRNDENYSLMNDFWYYRNEKVDDYIYKILVFRYIKL